MEHAKTSFREYTEWRKEVHAYEMPSFDPAKNDIDSPSLRIKRFLWPFCPTHGQTRDGCPVTYNLMGRFQVDPYLKTISLEEHKQTIYEGCVANMRYINALSRKNGRFEMYTILFDAKGLHMGLLSYRDHMKTDSALTQKLMPEVMHRCLIINTSSLVSTFYSMIRPLLHERVQRKITIVSESKTPGKLLELIAEDQLPQLYGGSCSCRGSAPCFYVNDGTVDIGTKEVKTVRFPLKESGLYSLLLLVKSRDVDISVDLFNMHETKELISLHTVTPNEPIFTLEFEAAANDEVELVLNNSRGSWRSKTVQYRIQEIQGGALPSKRSKI